MSNAMKNGNILGHLYGTDAAGAQRERYQNAVTRFTKLFGNGAEGLHLFRAPGRIEIGGNHTDHQNGQVLAAAIDLDMVAVAEALEGDEAFRIYSEGFGWIETEPTQAGTPGALVRGMAEEMRLRGFRTGVFRAYVTSNVPEGSGLSSSAAFEVLIGTILNSLYNDGAIPAVDIARMAQAAENRYYGKPCGLMDQMASAVGGLCYIDFGDPASPQVEKLDVDFQKMGYAVCITNTHGSHADHTEDYAAVQKELAKAADVFGKRVLEGVSPQEVIAKTSAIREAGGDRAFLRALHVAAENERVLAETDALKRKDMTAFLDHVRRSGDSSYKLLQNVHVDREPERQELAVALAVSEALLGNTDSACRVHGGGFAGTIQAFVSEQEVSRYRAVMDETFGEGSCLTIRICPEGGMEVKELVDMLR